MPLRHTLEPEQLAILTAVLDDICSAAGIEPQCPEREYVAGLVMHFYGRGYRTADELRAALEEAMRDERHYG
jgi:hypothetical protein